MIASVKSGRFASRQVPREPPCGPRGAPADAGTAPHARDGPNGLQTPEPINARLAATRASKQDEGWSHARR
jgi:hypothetical protein